MDKEPAAGIGGVISAALLVGWLILDQTGVGITEDMKDAVNALIYALTAVPFIAGLLIRTQVTPVAKAEAAVATIKENAATALAVERANAQEAVNAAYSATPTIDPKPLLAPPVTLTTLGATYP
jgi:hypothetical protein